MTYVLPFKVTVNDLEPGTDGLVSEEAITRYVYLASGTTGPVVLKDDGDWSAGDGMKGRWAVDGPEVLIQVGRDER